MGPGRKTLCAILWLGLCLPGCAWSRYWFDQNPYGDCGPVVAAPASKTELVSRVNQHIARLNGWRATNARVTYSAPGQPSGTLSAMLAVQAPKRFSLVASSPLGSEVEIGSNDERFWIWTKRDPSRQVLTARHCDLAQAQHRFPIPFQPEWVMEAMGVIPIDETRVREVQAPPSESGRPRTFLISDEYSPEGQPVRKAILVDASYGTILQHELISESGALIARARIYGHHPHPVTGIPIPGKIDLDWPTTGMQMRIGLGPVDINPQLSEQFWSMEAYPGYRIVDLGQPGVQNTSGP